MPDTVMQLTQYRQIWTRALDVAADRLERQERYARESAKRSGPSISAKMQKQLEIQREKLARLPYNQRSPLPEYQSKGFFRGWIDGGARLIKRPFCDPENIALLRLWASIHGLQSDTWVTWSEHVINPKILTPRYPHAKMQGVIVKQEFSNLGGKWIKVFNLGLFAVRNLKMEG